ncbi:unnamed protein product, partial [Staurois parvus]
YCVSCDWSQLVTWNKAVVNSLVPCDLCDHSQILHVVSNDVRSDILLILIHVITDWPISAPLAATADDHQVPAGDSPPAPNDRGGTLPGKRSVCKQYRSLPCQHQHSAL